MTLINSPIFWKGIVIGFCFGWCIASAVISVIILLSIDWEEKQDSRQAP